jgi:hypothetical protein
MYATIPHIKFHFLKSVVNLREKIVFLKIMFTFAPKPFIKIMKSRPDIVAAPHTGSFPIFFDFYPPPPKVLTIS